MPLEPKTSDLNFDIDLNTEQYLTAEKYDQIFETREAFIKKIEKELFYPLRLLEFLALVSFVQLHWIMTAVVLAPRLLIGAILYVFFISSLSPGKWESYKYRQLIIKRIQSLTLIFSALFSVLNLQFAQNQILSAFTPMGVIMFVGILIAPFDIHEGSLQNLFNRYEKTLQAKSKKRRSAEIPSV